MAGNHGTGRVERHTMPEQVENSTTGEGKICPLCGRPIPPGHESRHHLVPKLKGGKHGPVAILHPICHGKIHSLFREVELARHYDTIEKLLTHDEIRRFVGWVKKRPPGYRSSNRKRR